MFMILSVSTPGKLKSLPDRGGTHSDTTSQTYVREASHIDFVHEKRTSYGLHVCM
jgi:hypothetical protein